ncbi:MAG: hypothetical protein JW882_04680 [Deltaproteobacteria bacterium]|nr:hypothetical protein [Deltaproteobacteria bacterium]
MEEAIGIYLEQAKIGLKQSYKNLALFPLLSTYSLELDYLLLPVLNRMNLLGWERTAVWNLKGLPVLPWCWMIKLYICLFFHAQMTKNRIVADPGWEGIHSEEEIGYIDVSQRNGEAVNGRGEEETENRRIGEWEKG